MDAKIPSRLRIKRYVLAVSAIATFAFYAEPASATLVNLDNIILDIYNPIQSPPIPGQTYYFQGTIANNTGAAFAISDVVFNFLGFDPNQISSFNPLPDGDTFTIPYLTMSPVVTLFSLTLAPGISPLGTYQSDVVVSDPQGYYSNDDTVTITPIPEPASWALLVLGVGASALWALPGRRKEAAQ